MALTTAFLRGPVGAGLENAPHDVIGVKQRLRDIGVYRPPPEGIGDDVDADFEKAVRAFQKSVGLKVDGFLEPGGETERNLTAFTTGEGFEPSPPAESLILKGGVGAGGNNDPGDVTLIKRALGGIGAYPYDRTRPPPPYIDRKLVDAIQSFQRDRGLYDDGVVSADGETLQAIREAISTRRASSAGKRSDPGERPKETEVAALPAVLAAAVPWLIQAGRTLLPYVPPIAGGVYGTQKAIETTKKDPDIKYEATSPPPPIPPSPGEPEEPPEHEEFPAEPPKIPEGSSFPEPSDPTDLIEIFPNQSDKVNAPIIVESRGDERTQNLNDEIRKLVARIRRKFGGFAKHTGGARDEHGENVKETWMPNYETGGKKGSSRPDITFTSEKTNRRLFINTTTTLADRVTPDKREREAGVRIILNGETGDILVQIGKLREGETLDLESLEEFLRPLLAEIDKPAPEIDHRTTEEIQKRIHLYGRYQ